MLFRSSLEAKEQELSTQTEYLQTCQTKAVEIRTKIKALNEKSSTENQDNYMSGAEPQAPLEAELESIENEITTTETKIQKLNATISNLNTNISTLTQEKQDLQTTVDSLNAQVESLNEQISTLNAQITSLQEQLNNSEVSSTKVADFYYYYNDPKLSVKTKIFKNKTTCVTNFDLDYFLADSVNLGTGELVTVSTKEYSQDVYFYSTGLSAFNFNIITKLNGEEITVSSMRELILRPDVGSTYNIVATFIDCDTESNTLTINFYTTPTTLYKNNEGVYVDLVQLACSCGGTYIKSLDSYVYYTVDYYSNQRVYTLDFESFYDIDGKVVYTKSDKLIMDFDIISGKYISDDNDEIFVYLNSETNYLYYCFDGVESLYGHFQIYSFSNNILTLYRYGDGLKIKFNTLDNQLTYNDKVYNFINEVPTFITGTYLSVKDDITLKLDITSNTLTITELSDNTSEIYNFISMKGQDLSFLSSEGNLVVIEYSIPYPVTLVYNLCRYTKQ